MMTHVQYLLVKLAEESSELAKEALKGSQFGTDSTYQGRTNGELIRNEFVDVMTIIHLLQIWGDIGIAIPLTELNYIRTEDLVRIKAPLPRVCFYMLKANSEGRVSIPDSLLPTIQDYALTH